MNFGGVDNGDLWREIMRHVVLRGRVIEPLHGTYAHNDVRRNRLPEVLSHPELKRLYSLADDRRNTGTTSEPPIPLSDEAIPWTGVAEDTPRRHEIIYAVNQLRNSSPGEDGMRIKQLRESEELCDMLVELVQRCWSDKKTPRAFKRAAIVALPKKPGAVKWTDHRGITLLSVAGKTLARVIFNRARGAPMSPYQCGFRQYSSTSDAIFTLTNVKADARRCGLPLVCTYVDLTKAYDTIDRDFLWATAERQGLRGTALELVKSMYDDSICVRLGATKSEDRFKSRQGVRQGCLLSPMLFNWVFDRVLLQSLESMQGVPLYQPACKPDGTVPTPTIEELRVPTWFLKLIAYADDVVVVSPHMTAAQADFDAFANACARAGMTISRQKTEVQRMPDQRVRHAPFVGPLPAEFESFGPFRYVVVPDGTGPAPPWSCPLCDHTVHAPAAKPDDYANVRTKVTEHLGDVHLLGVSAVKTAPDRVTTTHPYKQTVRKTATTPQRYRCAYRGGTDGPTCGETFDTEAELDTHATQNAHVGVQLRAGNRRFMLPCVPDHVAMEAELRRLGLVPPNDTEPDDIFFGPGPNDTFARCDNFRYLGRITAPDGGDAPALSTRLAIAGKTAGQLLKGRLRRSTRAVKLEVWNAVVKAQVVYGSETWYISQHDRRRIDRFEAQWIRRVAGMLPALKNGVVHYPTTASVRHTLYIPPLIDIIDRARLRYLGHILRKEGSEAHSSITHRLCMPGRPSIARTDSLRTQLFDIMRSAGLKVSDVENRTVWRSAGDAWLRKRQLLGEGRRQLTTSTARQR